MRRELRAAGKRRVGAASTDARARRARRRPGHHARRHQRRRDRRHAHRVHRTRVPIAAPPGSAIKRVALGGRPSPPKPAPERPTTLHGWRWELCRGTGPLRTPNHGSRTVKNISIKYPRQAKPVISWFIVLGFFFGALGPFDRPWTRGRSDQGTTADDESAGGDNKGQQTDSLGTTRARFGVSGATDREAPGDTRGSGRSKDRHSRLSASLAPRAQHSLGLSSTAYPAATPPSSLVAALVRSRCPPPSFITTSSPTRR